MNTFFKPDITYRLYSIDGPVSIYEFYIIKFINSIPECIVRSWPRPGKEEAYKQMRKEFPLPLYFTAIGHEGIIIRHNNLFDAATIEECEKYLMEHYFEKVL